MADTLNYMRNYLDDMKNRLNEMDKHLKKLWELHDHLRDHLRTLKCRENSGGQGDG